MCENPEHSSPPFKDDVPEIEGTEQAKAAGKEPWACVLCGTADGSWPCSTRMEADEMLAQLDVSAVSGDGPGVS